MLKKCTILLLAMALLVSSTAMAEVTNRDMQLMGGVVVSSSVDSFFFAPMEAGMTRHWGLYSLKNVADGPIWETTDKIPARLVHATQSDVYFFGYTNEDRTLQSLYRVPVAGGSAEEMLSEIKAAFVDSNNTFMYVTESDPYFLKRFDVVDNKSTEIKDMSKSNKTMYDAVSVDGTVYFTTLSESGSEDTYKLQSNKKASNLDKPKPAIATSLLYENFWIYSTSPQGTSPTYVVPLGSTKAVSLTRDNKYNVELSSPRFGKYVYTYDAESSPHKLVGLALDNSGDVTLDLDGDTLSNLIMGGSSSELLFMNDGGIYKTSGSLGSASRLFDFNTSTGGQLWSHVVPAVDGHVIVMGYGSETVTHRGTMPPSGVYVFTSSGEMIFGYPEEDANAATAIDTATAGYVSPDIGTVPEVPLSAPESEGEGGGETVFEF